MINIYKKSDLIFEPDSRMTVTNIFISKLFIGLNILLDASYLIRLAKKDQPCFGLIIWRFGDIKNYKVDPAGSSTGRGKKLWNNNCNIHTFLVLCFARQCWVLELVSVKTSEYEF